MILKVSHGQTLFLALVIDNTFTINALHKMGLVWFTVMTVSDVHPALWSWVEFLIEVALK